MRWDKSPNIVFGSQKWASPLSYYNNTLAFSTKSLSRSLPGTMSDELLELLYFIASSQKEDAEKIDLNKDALQAS